MTPDDMGFGAIYPQFRRAEKRSLEPQSSDATLPAFSGSSETITALAVASSG